MKRVPPFFFNKKPIALTSIIKVTISKKHNTFIFLCMLDVRLLEIVVIEGLKTFTNMEK